MFEVLKDIQPRNYKSYVRIDYRLAVWSPEVDRTVCGIVPIGLIRRYSQHVTSKVSVKFKHFI